MNVTRYVVFFPSSESDSIASNFPSLIPLLKDISPNLSPTLNYTDLSFSTGLSDGKGCSGTLKKLSFTSRDSS